MHKNVKILKMKLFCWGDVNFHSGRDFTSLFISSVGDSDNILVTKIALERLVLSAVYCMKDRPHTVIIGRLVARQVANTDKAIRHSWAPIGMGKGVTPPPHRSTCP